MFLVAGLVTINNVEFGVAALGASVAALLWTTVAPRARALLSFGASVGAGLVGAYALVAILTLVRAGSLPQLERMSEFARVYALAGFNLIPLPALVGLHLVIYATYVAAIGAATVRAIRREPNRVLTGMLAWSGVFGLGAANYYVGRSGSETIVSTFSAWALALMLLTVVAARQLSAKRSLRPSLATVLVLFGFGVMACSIALTPTPWGQIQRLHAPPAGSLPASGPPESPGPLVPSQEPKIRRYVSSLADGRERFVVKHGAPVVIMAPTGHRIADAYGVVDVDPYTGLESIQLVSQFEDVLDTLRDAGGNTVLIATGGTDAVSKVLAERGFELVTNEGLQPWKGARSTPEGLNLGGFTKWVDTRHLHPAALR